MRGSMMPLSTPSTFCRSVPGRLSGAQLHPITGLARRNSLDSGTILHLYGRLFSAATLLAPWQRIRDSLGSTVPYPANGSLGPVLALLPRGWCWTLLCYSCPCECLNFPIWNASVVPALLRTTASTRSQGKPNRYPTHP